MASSNPLFPNDDDPRDDGKNSYILPDRRQRRLEPIDNSDNSRSADANESAANIARAKLDRLYGTEPDARDEEKEVQQEVRLEKPRSKHQEFMLGLSTSGKSLAQIQTEWHNYYTALSDHEKREVWQEFYQNNSTTTQSRPSSAPTQSVAQPISQPTIKPIEQVVESTPEPAKPVIGEGLSGTDLEELALTTPASQVRRAIERRQKATAKKLKKIADSKEQRKSETKSKKDKKQANVSQAKQKVRAKVRASEKSEKLAANQISQAKQGLKSILFGLSIGCIVIIISLFSFFNEIIIAPFIQPSRDVSSTPLIVGNETVSPTSQPEVIIPKINVEIPLVGFDLTTTSEAAFEQKLENGVTHYPTTVNPGQVGNTAFFGHSSNNIFNPGHYKFAFTLLHELVPGDTFYLTYNHKVYSYQVFEKKIVSPNNVSVLQETLGKNATATLITCDPPGTSNNRLVVWGEQVSPSPADNTNSAPRVLAQPAELQGNSPSLWSRMIDGITGWF